MSQQQEKIKGREVFGLPTGLSPSYPSGDASLAPSYKGGRMYERRKKQQPTVARERRHDVLIWQENGEWVVYDYVTDQTTHCYSVRHASEVFNAIKKQYPSAKQV